MIQWIIIILTVLQKTHRDQLGQLTESLNMARKEIETLRQREQEAALASAENKQKVHEELLKQGEEMVKLRTEREHLHHKGIPYLHKPSKLAVLICYV